MEKLLILSMLLILLTGCGTAMKFLDSTLADDQTVYEKSQPLPPLEIPPELK
jgi:uncharacterized lipoprotein